MLKRTFDFISSFFGLLILSPILLVMTIGAAVDTKSNGLFTQLRVGQYGKLFRIYKLRSMHSKTQIISTFGAFLRKSKIDELPQLYNVLRGDMSIVGPRPDIPGYYDELKGEDRKILELKPGLTSEASLKYFDEEELLAQQQNPLQYNDTILFPDKVKMNLHYYHHQSFSTDLRILFNTIFRS